MDPVSAIGLASNVLQLVDIGSKLLVSGYEAYKSNNGMNIENTHIADLANNLQLISRQLEQPPQAGGIAISDPRTGPISDHEAGLRDLTRKAQSLAQDLLRILERVKRKDKRFKTWSAVRSTFSACWNKDGIQSMRQRLLDIQCLMNTRLIGLIQSDQSSLKLGIQNSVATAGVMHEENLIQVASMEDNVISTIQSLGDQMSKSLRRVNEHQNLERHAAVRRYEESLAKLASAVNSLRLNSEDPGKTDLILNSLAFSEMDERYDRIEEPCEGTFQWILKDGISPLPQWLRVGSGLFLISGKAGCGKSTMMKTIFDDTKTLGLLEQWAGSKGKSLVTAQFFFWNSGSNLQKTHDGLLRSLLLQALIPCRDIVPTIFPRRWNSDHSRLSKTWTRQELSNAVLRLSEQNGANLPCYCFFIDGLDEYQGQMRYFVEDLCRLIRSPYVKICAASRSRNVLDRAFGANNKLVLHQYTRNDIRIFVERRLVNDPAFRDLVQSDPKVGRIVTAIQDRAQGVFLWVFLVVQDLLRELDDYGTLEELEDRLRALPPDLHSFFKRIVESIEQPYQQNMARLLLLIDAGGSVPLTAVHFLYQDTKDEGYVLNNELQIDGPDAMEKWEIETKAQIKKWCKDLLEVIDPGPTGLGPVVRFSHQSVRDYVRLPDVERYLVSLAGHNFHATHTLCRLSLAHLRVALCKCNVMATYEFERMFRALVERVMYFAASYELRTGHTLRELLNKLNEFCSAAIAIKPWSLYWSMRICFRDSSAGREESSRLEFLSFAASCGLTNFIREEMGSTFDHHDGTHILYGALRPHGISPSFLFRAGRLSVIKFLLSCGIDPNAELETSLHTTVWEQFLLDIYLARKSDFTPGEFLQVVEMLLDAGADTNCCCFPGEGPSEPTLTNVLNRHTGVTTRHHEKLRIILSARGLPEDNTSDSDT